MEEFTFLKRGASDLQSPKRLKTLILDVKYSGGNNLLHCFVLENSYPNACGKENYLSGKLRTMSSELVNCLNDNGHSALHLAVFKRNKLMVEKMTSCLPYMDINQKTRGFKETPLHLAAGLGYPDIIETLLQKGARAVVGNCSYFTPFHKAVMNNHVGAVKMFLSRGAKEDLPHDTALHFAVEKASCEIIELLLMNGANVNAKIARGKTPLHLSIDRDDTEVTKILLRYKAEVNELDFFGYTALYKAVRRGNRQMIALLLANGADVDITRSAGNSPLSVEEEGVMLEMSVQAQLP